MSKQRARSVATHRGQRFYTPAQTAEAEFTVGLLIKQATPELFPDDTTAFGVRAQFFSGSRQRRDIDNLLKLIMDSATGLVWKDDSQVMELAARRFMGDPNPRTDFVIYRLPVGAAPTQQCEGCGSEFKTYPSWSKRRFCSRTCSAQSQQRRTSNHCGHCNKEMIRAPTHHRKFCSEECRLNYETPEFECGYCHKLFRRPRSLIRTPIVYCSESCLAQAWATKPIKTKSGQGACADCGRPTSTRKRTRCQACRLKSDPPRSPGRAKDVSRVAIVVEEML